MPSYANCLKVNICLVKTVILSKKSIFLVWFCTKIHRSYDEKINKILLSR